jgi:hypothetical protein
MTQYDVKDDGSGSDSVVKYYKVRKAWSDVTSQLGVYI